MQWLRERGYLIVERNWRIGHYEIDILAQHYDTLHFVEVKTRHEGSLTTPAEAMSRKKISNLLRAANHYIELNAITSEAWIDFAAVIVGDDGTMSVEFIPDVANLHW